VSTAETFAELLSTPRWVAWHEEITQGGRATKKPYAVHGSGPGSSTNPATWGTHSEAEMRARRLGNGANGEARKSGCGIVLGELDEQLWLAGIDLDSCLDENRTLALWASRIIEKAPSVAEISPSGRGLKVFFYLEAENVRTFLSDIGVKPENWGCKLGIPGLDGAGHGPGVEIYCARHFFTVTGEIWDPKRSTIELLDCATLAALALAVRARSTGTGERRCNSFSGAPPFIRRPGSTERTDRSRSADALSAARLWFNDQGGRDSDATYEEMKAALRDSGDPRVRQWFRDKGQDRGEHELKNIWAKLWRDDDEEDATGSSVDPEAGTADDPDPIILHRLSPVVDLPRPRQWLCGFSFCRGFTSSVTAPGKVGKSSLRLVQAVALTSGVELTGERIWQQCRVLMLSFEDDLPELKRRLEAIMLHFKDQIDRSAVAERLVFASVGPRQGRLMVPGKRSGKIEEGPLLARVKAAIDAARPDVSILDPLAKTHAVPENDNIAMDIVATYITDLTADGEMAVDAPHHDRKGGGDPGDQERGRGASSWLDAIRLGYTLTRMSKEDETKLLADGAAIDDRRRFIRYDSAGINLCPPQEALWFRLESVALGNGDEIYPNGDSMQVAVRWYPPEIAVGSAGMPEELTLIAAAIDAGLPDGRLYSDSNRSTNRSAWEVVKRYYPSKNQKECRTIVNELVTKGVLVHVWYRSPGRRREPEQGLLRQAR
jgi:hypothetical protein